MQEFHPFDPHRAAKDIEVGDFYFKKKNYRAALERYREALFFKPNDAMANFRMAQALEKLNRPDDAVDHYSEYLRILPNGPLSEEAKKSMAKLKAASAKIKPSSDDPAEQARFGQQTTRDRCPHLSERKLSSSLREWRDRSKDR